MSKRIQDSGWYKERPSFVQQKIDTYPYDQLYRLKTTNQIVSIYSYAESKEQTCETCTVDATKKYNPEMFVSRRVFGIKFEDLEKYTEQG